MQSDEHNPSPGRISSHGKGAGEITLDAIERRARELAVIAGREGPPTDSDRDDALRELSGNTEAETPGTPENASGISRSRDPAEPAVSTGRESRPRVEPDEEEIAVQLATEGVDEAQHDLMLADRREERKRLRSTPKAGELPRA